MSNREFARELESICLHRSSTAEQAEGRIMDGGLAQQPAEAPAEAAAATPSEPASAEPAAAPAR